MEISGSGAAAIPVILITVAVPLIIFILIPVLIVRSILKAIKSKLPAGASISQLRELARQFPKGTDWQKVTSQWDFSVDPTTRQMILKRKAGASKPSGSSQPDEIRVNSISELPSVLEQLGIERKTPPAGRQSGKIESKEPPPAKPASASSRITSVKTTHSGQMTSPKSYEIIQTIKRVAIILFLVGIYYGIRGFLG